MKKPIRITLIATCLGLLPHQVLAQQDAESLVDRLQTACVSCHAQWKQKARR